MNAVLINRHNISESFSFATWQRLQELGLSEEGIEAKRIELHSDLISELIDEEEFKQKLVELGIVILKVQIVHIEGYNRKQSTAMAGPAQSFDELDEWWLAKTGRDCPLYTHLASHHANSPLVRDRWEKAVVNNSPFAIGALSEIGSKL